MAVERLSPYAYLCRLTSFGLLRRHAWPKAGIRRRGSYTSWGSRGEAEKAAEWNQRAHQEGEELIDGR